MATIQSCGVLKAYWQCKVYKSNLNLTMARARTSRHWEVLFLLASACCIRKFVRVVHGQKQQTLRTAPYTEIERQEEFERRGHTWPLPEYVPSTEGWAQLLDKLFSQVGAIEDPQEKWFAWTSLMGPALTIPNYTEYGWGLTQAPKDLTDDLHQAILEGLPNARLEQRLKGAIDGPTPLFIDREDLTQRVSEEVQPILEAWSGMELVPSMAYGFRLYRNESRLWMHVDQAQTHVISCIYHIASSDDSDPWPIILEDFGGNTNSIILKPGDILLYESSKAFHGRPQQFQGSWYTSVFVHFYPNEKDWWDRDRELDKHYAIPDTWRNVHTSTFSKLSWVGTNMFEPDCDDYWCNLQQATTLEGPGDFGHVITGGGERYLLHTTTETYDGSDDDEHVEL